MEKGKSGGGGVGVVYPSIRAILSLYFSLPWRNLRGVMLDVGLFFLFIYQFLYFFILVDRLLCHQRNYAAQL